MLANIQGKTMEFNRSSSSSTKIERKVIEKNRRNQMKALFSKLNSLLPNHNTLIQESLPLPDQVDEAINHIKSLEDRLKKLNEEKESLTGRKRLFDYINCEESKSSSRAPQLEIKELGSALEVVLVTGLNSHSMFNEVIRILHEEGIEVVNASFSTAGNSVFHVVHGQMKEYMVGFGAAKVRERLNRYINGSTSKVGVENELWDFDVIDPIRPNKSINGSSGEVELENELWDFDVIDPLTWLI